MSFDAHGPGTPSSVWEADDRLAAVPEADLSAMRELIVVAAHPDDETLGCGGLIVRAAGLGIPVRVIAVTDGSASHPRSKTVTTRDLRAHRAMELREAVSRLAPGAIVSWLGFPDGRTEDFVEAIEDRLRTELSPAIAGTWVAVTSSGDGHRDHRIVGEITERVAPGSATLWSYPIWMWHWATPDSEGIPWERAVSVSLTEAEVVTKQHALSAFVTQMEPLSPHPGDERVLEPGVLEHFARRTELFFAAPTAAAASAPQSTPTPIAAQAPAGTPS